MKVSSYILQIYDMAGDVMMLKKLAAAVIAALTAIVPFSAGDVNVLTPMGVYAEEAGNAASAPGWIPDDFESALEFRNTYGATHIEDGLICIVLVNEDAFPSDSDMLRYQIVTTENVMETLSHKVYTADDTKSKIEVYVYKPVVQGDIEVAVVDTWLKSYSLDLGYNHASAYYTFTADKSLSVTETDICSWLPDCEKEYWDYADKNSHLSVKDNYVVFCLSHGAGTGYEWTLKDEGNKCFELKTVSDCSSVSAFPIDGGQVNTIFAYKAVKDGYDKISYDFGAVYAGDEEGKKTLTADCAIINDAQTVLLSGDMRVTLVDYDTGELLTIADGAMPAIWTDIRQVTPEGEINCNMQPSGFRSNPAIVGLGSFFDGYDFSFGLGSDGLPVGYCLPETEEKTAGYYNGTIVPDDHMTIKKYDNDTADVVFRLKKSNASSKRSTKITFYDTDTGELIDIPSEKSHICKYTTQDPYRSETFDITSNPCKIDSDQVYEPSYSYYFMPETRSGWYNYLQFETTSENSDCIELVCRMKWNPSGDFNGDNNFSISDVILLQKWLLGSTFTETADFKAADFCRDNVIDVFDLVLMRRELINQGCLYVEPDVKVGYAPLTVLEDDLKLYIGPDESYGYVEGIRIPKGTELNEKGYQNDNDKWIFVFYQCRYGWIKTVKKDNITPTIRYEVVCDKPVIYLYPEEETDVRVELELTEADLSTTYPKYNNGWDVVASPDGSLLNKADGTHHKYLFWDAVNCRTRFDFSKGFCVAGSDTESFLKEKLTYMGLTEEEMNEFIVYWLPKMEHNAYNLISFQGDIYTDSARLNITPEPDSLLRVFMTYVPLEDAVDIQTQQLVPFERNGFTVVEWGGSELAGRQ